MRDDLSDQFGVGADQAELGEDAEPHVFAVVHKVLNRMRDNHNKGKGIHISADELEALSITFIGAAWREDAPEEYQ